MLVMTERGRRENPYRSLGACLKSIREGQKQSVAEVSGAVEVDIEVITSFELGVKRPSEDILLLLISHFDVKDSVANKLWRLANYDQPSSQEQDAKAGIIVSPNDARILYTDLVYVTSNQHGLVMNFMQESGPQSQPLIVSRVGMSREHAKAVLEVLNQSLMVKPKYLPAPNSSKSQKTNKKHKN